MTDIIAPFTQEQVDNINKYQQNPQYHPFTCCSPDEIEECKRRNDGDEGLLIASKDGLTCPCGKYKQEWVYNFMTLNREDEKQ